MHNQRKHAFIAVTIVILFLTSVITGKRGGGSRGSSGSRSSGSRSSGSSSRSSSSSGSRSSGSSSYHSNTYYYGNRYGSSGGSGDELPTWAVVFIVIVLVLAFTVVIVYYCSKAGCCEQADEELTKDVEDSEPLNPPPSAYSPYAGSSQSYPYSVQPQTTSWPSAYPTHPLPPSQRGDTGFRESPTDPGPPLQTSTDIPMQSYSDNKRVFFGGTDVISNPSAPPLPGYGFQ